MLGKVMKLPILFLQIICAYFESLFRLFVPHSRQDIQGQNVLITGAAGGIGTQLSIQFAALNTNLILIDLDRHQLDRLVDQVSTLTTGQVKGYICDITKKSNVDNLFDDIRNDFGNVDVLVNNAGVLPSGKINDLSQRTIELTFNVNILSHFWTIQQALPAMKNKGKGIIIEIASMAGIAGTSMLTDYSASKFAVVGLSQSLKHELHAEGYDNIGVTCICPMFVQTNLIAKTQEHSDFTTKVLLQPDYVASVIIDSALRRKLMVSIPCYFLRMVEFIRFFFPIKAAMAISDFLNEGFHPKDEKKSN